MEPKQEAEFSFCTGENLINADSLYAVWAPNIVVENLANGILVLKAALYQIEV